MRAYAPMDISCESRHPIKKLEEVAGRAKQLVREKNEATAKTRFLEREASELRSLISLAESKVDEMLGVGAQDQTPQAMNAAVESKGIQQFGGSPTSPPKGRKSGFPRAFGLD